MDIEPHRGCIRLCFGVFWGHGQNTLYLEAHGT